MSAIKMRVLPLLPAQIVGIEPIVVSKQGNVYEISIAAIAMSQVIQQLSIMNLFDEVYEAVPGNLNDPVRIAFNGSGYTQIGTRSGPGPVFSFLKSTLNWSTSQLNTFINSASMLSY